MDEEVPNILNDVGDVAPSSLSHVRGKTCGVCSRSDFTTAKVE